MPLYCRKCGNRLPAESTFCPSCGTSQSADVHTPTSFPLTEPEQSGGTGRLPAGRMLHQRYRLLQTVGQGGMGAVYVAQDAQLGDRLVAVKEMSMSRLTQQELPHAVNQFQHEAHLLASLHHANLPAIYDYFGEEERWYLVMQFIEGGTLQSLLDTAPGNRLPVNEVVRIGMELCEVLEYLHTHQPQVIFRDLKPLNIMVTPKGRVALIDFGIARHFKLEQAKDTTHYYSVGYAPPEQYGQSQTGPRSDLYSLGATLYQMLSGQSPSRRPFQFPNLQLIDPAIPLPLAGLIAQMLEMDEQSRPASAAEVKVVLEKVLRPESVIEVKKAEIEQQSTVQAEQEVVQQKEPVKAEQEIVEQKEPVKAEQMVQKLSDLPVKGRASVPENPANKPGLFPRRGQLTAWAWAFSLAVITGLFTGIVMIIDANQNGYYIRYYVLLSGVITAFVGLIALATRGRFLVDILGGIIIVIGSEFALIDIASGIVSNSSGAYILFIMLLNILSLAVGLALFLRRANGLGGFIFGIVLLFLILCVWVVISSEINDNGYDNLSAIPLFVWIPSFVASIFTFVVPLVKRNQRKKSVIVKG